MRTRWIILISLLLIWLPITVLAAEAQIDVEVSCSLNADEFAAGDVLQGFMSLENRAVDVAVDIFVAIVMPDGSMVSLTQNGFAVGIWPWYSDLTLPSSFAAGPEMIIDQVVPTDAVPGSYTYVTAVSRAGTGSLGLLSVDQCPFQVHALVGSHYYVDGQLGDDAYDGSRGSPWKTVNRSLRYGGSEADPITIHVAAGIYAASTNGERFPLNMKSWVSVVGQDARNTILDAGGYAPHVFYCNGVDNSTIKGLTITGGRANGGYADAEGRGAGIYCEKSSPAIKDNVIRNNSASWYGGGIFSDEDSSPSILNNVVEDNESGTYGGGICAMGDSTEITGNYVAHNSTGGHSGGIQIEGDSPLLSNNLILGNRANWGFGGGILCATRSGLITNNTIYGNYASCEEARVGGIYCCGGARPTIENCIVWGNGSWDLSQEYTCRVKATFCCIGAAYDSMSGRHCISEDPMFAWGPLGDYYLDPQSPCIDAGRQSAAEAGLSDRTTQVDGTPDTGRVDMGYHYPIPVGERPIAYIDSISPNPATQYVDTIQFVGHGTDADGTVEAHEWSSDLKGILSTSDHFSCPAWRLELGAHVISYRVQDDSGLWSRAATQELIIEAQFPIPVAYIDSILPNPAVQGRDTVEFRGHGTDKDGPIEAYEWSSNLDGILSVEKDFEKLASGLSLGTHTISFRVQDDDYQWSESATERLAICIEGTQHLYVNGEVGNDLGDGSPDAPFKTITCALASALVSEESLATIHAAAGTYSATTNGETYPLTMRSLVSISGDGADATILDGEYSADHIIRCMGVENLIVEGLTMTGGAAYGASEADQCGGAVYCVNSSLRIQSNIITDNYAAVGGAAIYCYYASPLIIANTISSNKSDYGAGICCVKSSPSILKNTIRVNDAGSFGGGIYCEEDSSPLIEQNTILNNYASLFGAGIYCERSSAMISNNSITYNIVSWQSADTNGGGGICCKNCSPTITGNTISHNYARLLGGGILCDESSPMISGNTIDQNETSISLNDPRSFGGGIYCENDSSPTIKGNTITGNSAWEDGGGIYCEHSSPTIADNEVAYNSVDNDGAGIYLSQSSPTMSGNIISENQAGERGGGIFCAHSSPTISNNLIIANSVYGRFGFDGGGIYCDSHSSPIITNNTIVGNSAAESGAGGGIYSEEEGTPTIEDCIIWANGDDLDGCLAAFSCIEDEDEGEGNIHDDPMFVAGPLGDYYLHPDSPCIDAGSKSAEEAGLSEMTTQADGEPDTGTVDMGFHYPVPAQ